MMRTMTFRSAFRILKSWEKTLHDCEVVSIPSFVVSFLLSRCFFSVSRIPNVTQSQRLSAAGKILLENEANHSKVL